MSSEGFREAMRHKPWHLFVWLNGDWQFCGSVELWEAELLIVMVGDQFEFQTIGW